jgi:hypothetical protein
MDDKDIKKKGSTHKKSVIQRVRIDLEPLKGKEAEVTIAVSSTFRYTKLLVPEGGVAGVVSVTSKAASGTAGAIMGALDYTMDVTSPAFMKTIEMVANTKVSAANHARKFSKSAEHRAYRTSIMAIQSVKSFGSTTKQVLRNGCDVVSRNVDTAGESVRDAAVAISEKTKYIPSIIANVHAAGFVSLSTDNLLKWSESVTKSSATIFDRALDAEYIRSHVGGGNHRMFDGGHDLVGAWDAVRGVSGNDTLTGDIASYASALWKDVTTVKGLPFVTWSKGSYDLSANWVVDNIPGATKKWFYDVNSYDVFEVLSVGLGVASSIYLLKKKDTEKLAEILGQMGITSIVRANALLAISVILITAYAYARAKRSGSNEVDNKNAMISAIKGGGLSGVALAITSVMGVGVVTFGVTLAVTILMRNYVFDQEYVLEKIAGSTNKLKRIVGGGLGECDAVVVQGISPAQ